MVSTHLDAGSSPAEGARFTEIYNMKDINQVALKMAYVLKRKYATSDEMKYVIENMVSRFEEEDLFFIREMKLSIEQGEFTEDDISTAFKNIMNVVLNRTEF